MPVFLTRRVALCASHRLHAPGLSDEENLKIYGKCNNPNGHGHNYVVKVTVCGDLDPITGMVMNAVDLKNYMKNAVMDTMDHKCIDKDIEYFRTKPSTAENIAVYIWEQLKPHMKKEKCSLYKVQLFETENVEVEYMGP
uniref:6-pyruvoyl tetrahydrobiopterin synthase n=1 Tax=Ciona savignyi TaxID=51511 RepID=H2YHZ7_CIOSA